MPTRKIRKRKVHTDMPNIIYKYKMKPGRITDPDFIAFLQAKEQREELEKQREELMEQINKIDRELHEIWHTKEAPYLCSKITNKDTWEG